MYRVSFEKPHQLTAGEETTIVVDEYDDYGSMYTLELTDGQTQSVGKQLVESIEAVDE